MFHNDIMYKMLSYTRYLIFVTSCLAKSLGNIYIKSNQYLLEVTGVLLYLFYIVPLNQMIAGPRLRTSFFFFLIK